MKTKIDYDLLNREMLDDIRYMVRKLVDIDQLKEKEKSDLYGHLLEVWYILEANRNNKDE
ncbi:unnamed protein product [marine sediment metagenome]|uniref:Uncharacterized protein n=1 Tax=marine sediment metagenome TaxID=412755 RepID=X1JGC7_9ZZZZ